MIYDMCVGGTLARFLTAVLPQLVAQQQESGGD